MILAPLRPIPFRGARPRQAGSAVIVVIGILAILLIYIGANLRTLHCLGRELRLVERQQLRRLAAECAPPATNAPARLALPTASAPTNSPPQPSR